MNNQNVLALKKPKMASQWHPTKNRDLTPNDVTCGSHQVVWWHCDKDPEHEWDAPIVGKALEKTCPYCSGKRIIKSNSFALLRPELLYLWNYGKNSEITPEEIAPHSNIKVHWKCEREHEWETSPAKIKNCPFCNNRKVDNSNSLKTLHPNIAKEWHPHKNAPLKPSQIIPGSPKKVWWQCSNCRHEWDTTVRHRAERGTNCPECSKWTGTSFSEQSIYYYLHQLFPQTKSRYRYAVNEEKVELDIYVPELNLGIEYDGYRYHKSQKKMSSDHQKNILLRGHVQLIRIREKGLKPVPEEGSIVYNRTSNQKNTLHVCIQFVIDYLLTQPLSEKVKQAISSLTIDPLKDSVAIYEQMNLQDIENSLGTKHSHIISYWDNEKNGNLSPFKVKESNESIVAWKCEHGHAWDESIRNVAVRQYVCTTCNSFGHNYTELLKRWDYAKNTIDPYEITPGSKVSAFWLCDENQNHSYERVIHAEIKSKGCPYCMNWRVGEDNNLQVVCPELVKEWHPTKNESLTPSEVTTSTTKAVWWRCKEGHEWESQVAPRLKEGEPSECPKCKEINLFKTSSLYAVVKSGHADEKLLIEWNREKNGDLTPKTILSGSSKKISWICEHGHEWKSSLYRRVNREGNCIKCNSFGFLYPELLKEWDFQKNKIDPFEIAKKSSKKVWWKCEEGHGWQAIPNSRTQGRGNCKTCNSIGFKHSHLLKEWNYEKNIEIDPFSVAKGNSKLQINWKCTHGHEWIANPYARSRGGNHCPTCNSLGFLNPLLAEEFHPTKNPEIDVMTIAVSSGKKIWWKCKQGHEWRATVSHRKNGTGCPYCP